MKCLCQLLKNLSKYDTLAKDLLNDSTYCEKDYTIWEKKITLYLQSKGYKVGNWKTTARDSFGVLGRGVTINEQLYTYG